MYLQLILLPLCSWFCSCINIAFRKLFKDLANLQHDFYHTYRVDPTEIPRWIVGLYTSTFCRPIATGQVLRYLPDHFFFFFQANWTLASSCSFDHSKWAEPIAIEFDITVISCAWMFWSYYDKTRHLTCRYLTFTPQNAPETLSDGHRWSKIQIFLGEHAPRPP